MNSPKKSLKSIMAIEANILWTRAKTSALLSLVEQHRFQALSNISSQILEKRQLINQTTDDIYRDRYNALKILPAKTVDDLDYKSILEMESRIDVLEHRHKLNKSMLDVAEMMGSVNRQLLEVTELLQETNQHLNEFNHKRLSENMAKVDLTDISSAYSHDEIKEKYESSLQRIEVLLEKTKGLSIDSENFLEEVNNRKNTIQEQKQISDTIQQEIELVRHKLENWHINFYSE